MRIRLELLHACLEPFDYIGSLLPFKVQPLRQGR